METADALPMLRFALARAHFRYTRHEDDMAYWCGQVDALEMAIDLLENDVMPPVAVKGYNP